MDSIRGQVGGGKVICALSGGVDSAVAAALVNRAVGSQLTCIFVDNGLMRRGEPDQVVETFNRHLEIDLLHVDAAENFLGELAGVTDPEEKRRRIGRVFIEVFDAQAASLGQVDFLTQGTLYPDVIESETTDNKVSAKIKTHHNVGGLPENMKLNLVEPLRYLFKDEVREVGLELGLPEEMVFRQPFPGPGLAIRIIGEVTHEKLETLRAADWIVMEEIKAADLYRELWQSFRGAHRHALGGRDRRLQDIRRCHSRARRHQRRGNDGRLEPPAIRGTGAHLQPDRQRGAGSEPGGLRHHEQAAGHHRVGVGRPWD